jgi:CRISPR-associated protein Csm3
MTNKKPIKGKIFLSGKLVIKTGVHIGAAEGGLAIGGMDQPVVRDPLTREPYIPGSSLKGKLRSLLERSLDMEFNKNGGNEIWRHECNETSCPVCRLFGASKIGRGGQNIPSRLQFRDAFLTEESRSNLSELEEGLPFTEWKTENSLDRVTCAAMPRNIERVPAGSVFKFEIVYTIDKDTDIKVDLDNLHAMLKLLEDDALGGGGSRGSGRVEVTIDSVILRRVSHYLSCESEIPVEFSGDGLGSSVASAFQTS